MEKLEFSVEPELDRCFPGQCLANVEITLKDGVLLRSETCEAPGECDDPAQRSPHWLEKENQQQCVSVPL